MSKSTGNTVTVDTGLRRKIFWKRLMPLSQNPLQSSFFNDYDTREERRERDGAIGSDRTSDGQLAGRFTEDGVLSVCRHG